MGVAGGSRAALFGFAITALSMIALLGSGGALVTGMAVVSALVGSVFALAGLGVALGRVRVLLAVPVALAFIALLSVVGAVVLLDRTGARGRFGYATAALVTSVLTGSSAVGLWRVLPRGWRPESLKSGRMGTPSR